MKKLLLLIPALLLVACEIAPTTVCKDGIIYWQVGITGSVYRKSDPVIVCIDIKSAEVLK